jgi:L-alanine-DL-glutamate epimerase-like enolase superfamily enzyme
MITVRGLPEIPGGMSGSQPAGARAPITGVSVAVYSFPTPQPEADGTLTWEHTTVVAVSLQAEGKTGLGWTYSSPAAADIIRHHLAAIAHQHDAFAPAAGWEQMRRVGRNFGTRGLYMQAISAVDIAWWDLKARLLDLPLVTLFGQFRDIVPIYGSGGFTNLSDRQLAEQVAWWDSVGCTAMKIKIGEAWGSRIERDLRRVRRLAELAGPHAQLMVDANGGYAAGPARRVGRELDELGVVWFEEPVSSDDIDGLAAVRAALDCDVTAGEYAADLYDVRALLPVVDCLQLDLTRCGGYACGSRRPGPQSGSVRALRPRAAHPGRRGRAELAPRRVVRRPRPYRRRVPDRCTGCLRRRAASGPARHRPRPRLQPNCRAASRRLTTSPVIPHASTTTVPTMTPVMASAA